MSAAAIDIDDKLDGARLGQKVGAEAVGTFALVFAGCGAIMVDQLSGGQLTHVGVALTFGLVIAVMIAATGHISGAHFNPAVTLAFASAGRFPWRQVPAYIAGQVGAAILAAFMLRLVIGDVASMGATQPTIALGPALVLEIVGTFFLMFVIIAVATDSRASSAMAGPAIGGTVALCSLFAGPLSGASLNPARSLGPALAAGELGSMWLYIAGPLLGALAGAWTYRLICCTSERANQARGCC